MSQTDLVQILAMALLTNEISSLVKNDDCPLGLLMGSEPMFVKHKAHGILVIDEAIINITVFPFKLPRSYTERLGRRA